MKIILASLFLICTTSSTIYLPFGGNAWAKTNGFINESGYNFDKYNSVVTAYIYIGSSTKNSSITLAVSNSAPIQLDVTIGSKTIKKSISASSTIKSVTIGQYNFTQKSYNKITIKVVKNSTISSISGIIEGANITSTFTDLWYTQNNDDSGFYWGRRQCSCHLTYDYQSSNVTQYYSEVTSPAGYDTVGSYFMAVGFDGGYFGIQVNSPTQRRVLFSVWSLYDTNDASQIPAEYTVVNLAKGPNVTIGTFSGQGSGGQSYLVYPWKADITYKFLVEGKPLTDQNATVFTAYFYSPTQAKWRLIASFKRPKSQVHLTGFYSFLQNFSPDTGNIVRKARYGNQWINGSNGWEKSTSATFTQTNNGKKIRRDVSGGIEQNMYYLQNSGFSNQFMQDGTALKRTDTNSRPAIDLTNLLK